MIYAENILVCISVPLIISLIFLKGNVRRFTVSILTGMIVCLIAAYISAFTGMAGMMSENDTMIFVSPIIEELLKFLPLLFCLFMFEPEDEELFLISIGIGTGFATFENFCHILNSGADNFAYIMIRGMVVGVMHIVSIYAVSMGLVLVRRFSAFSFAGIAGALTLSMIFHGLYNLLVSGSGITTVIGYAMPLVTAAVLYLLYRRIQNKEE